jgi:hypothetical protein
MRFKGLKTHYSKSNINTLNSTNGVMKKLFSLHYGGEFGTGRVYVGRSDEIFAESFQSDMTYLRLGLWPAGTKKWEDLKVHQ